MERTTQTIRCDNAYIAYVYATRYPPFDDHQLHTHQHCGLYCCFRGDGYYIIEGVRHRLEHGRIFLIRPGEMHMAELIGSEPYESMSCHFSPSIVDKFDPERRLLAPFFNRPLGLSNVYDRSVVAPTQIYTLFQKMREQEQDNYDNCLHVSSLLFSVLDEIKKLYDAELFSAPSIHSALMHEVISYVNQNLPAELSPDLVCSKFFISRAQLDRNFKRSTGSTLWAYITSKRLLLAKAYIDDGMRATEAASACGFRDYSTFYRSYLRQYGVPPTGALGKITQ